MSIEPGTHWHHKREGFGVTVAEDLAYDRVETKDANDAQWQPGVGYVRDDNAEILFVRSRPDFLAKFIQDEGEG